MWVSPAAAMSRSTRPCRAMTSSMWERKPTGVSIVDAPVPSRSTVTRTLVSFVMRDSSADRLMQSLEEAIVLLRRPDRDAKRVGNGGTDVADEKPAGAELFKYVFGIAAQAKCDEVRLRWIRRDSGHRSHDAGDALALGNRMSHVAIAKFAVSESSLSDCFADDVERVGELDLTNLSAIRRG